MTMTIRNRHNVDRHMKANSSINLSLDAQIVNLGEADEWHEDVEMTAHV